MPAKRDVKIETPGAAPLEPLQEAEQAASDVSDAALNGHGIPAPTVEPESGQDGAMTPGQEATLAEQLVTVSKLRGAPSALDWSHLSGAGAIAGAALDPDAGLPDHVDPEKISEPTLSKSGWVMPANDPRVRFGQR